MLVGVSNWVLPYLYLILALRITCRGDETVCFHCGGGLHLWKVTDDVWEEHVRWFPFCVFVRYLRECRPENASGRSCTLLELYANKIQMFCNTLSYSIQSIVTSQVLLHRTRWRWADDESLFSPNNTCPTWLILHQSARVPSTNTASLRQNQMALCRWVIVLPQKHVSYMTHPPSKRSCQDMSLALHPPNMLTLELCTICPPAKYNRTYAYS
jgi:hypothetical protein